MSQYHNRIINLSTSQNWFSLDQICYWTEHKQLSLATHTHIYTGAKGHSEDLQVEMVFPIVRHTWSNVYVFWVDSLEKGEILLNRCKFLSEFDSCMLMKSGLSLEKLSYASWHAWILVILFSSWSPLVFPVVRRVWSTCLCPLGNFLVKTEDAP